MNMSQHADKILLGLAIAASALVGGLVLFLLARVLSNGLLKKEVKHFFFSPIAWLVMAGFAFVNGYVFLFLIDLYSGTFANVPFATVYFSQNFFLWILLLFIIPAITMRLIAEEKATGTIETLMTAPVRDAEVVFAKYAAAMVFFVIMWLPTVPLILALYYYGVPDAKWLELQASPAAVGWHTGWEGLGHWHVLGFLKGLPDGVRYGWHILKTFPEVMDVGPFLTAYLGLFLMGSAWISIGLLASSFAKNQVVAFMSAFVALIMLFAIGFAESLVHEDPAWLPHFRDVVHYISFINAFERFPKGVVDTRAVIYFASLTIVSLFFTVRVVESRKWR